MDQFRAKHLPSKRKQFFHSFSGKCPYRAPFYRKPKDQRIQRRIKQILRHKGPWAKSHISHDNSYDGRTCGTDQCREKESLKKHLFLYIGLLHGIDTGKRNLKCQYTQNRTQNVFSVKGRNQRRSQKYNGIENP